jgi:hypothetical protein
LTKATKMVISLPFDEGQRSLRGGISISVWEWSMLVNVDKPNCGFCFLSSSLERRAQLIALQGFSRQNSGEELSTLQVRGQKWQLTA